MEITLTKKEVTEITETKEVVTEITETKEVNLPYFSKDSCHHYKVFKEGYDGTVIVYDKNEIYLSHHDLAFNSDNVECTEAEFNEARRKAIENLSKL